MGACSQNAWQCYLGNHGESKQVADAADDSDEDLSAVTLP